MRRPSTLRSADRFGGLAAVALAALAMTVVACAPGAGTSGTASTVPTDLPVSTASTASATPVATATSAPATPAASNAVLVDRTLLDILPVDVGGVVLTSDPETAANIAADPSLAGTVQAIAVAFAIAPGASQGDDVAIAIVAQLRSGVFDEVFYGAYRDAYDEAACRSAGGVEGAAKADIAGRVVHVGTCSAGAHTYHVYLEAQDAIVSVTSVGPLGLGKQVMAGLRE